MHVFINLFDKVLPLLALHYIVLLSNQGEMKSKKKEKCGKCYKILLDLFICLFIYVYIIYLYYVCVIFIALK